LDKYKWQIGMSYFWNAMLYLLILIRHRKIGPEVDKFWELIGKVLLHRSQVFAMSPSPIYIALGNWTLEA
jgi:hypothetical protein